ncbi:MAG TPA: hypothetical protein VFL80_07930, partial [Thermoanaerobaculia bacterium]|nr:hypothetical protein [Thermoanaerobaculia bacterium]
IGAAASCFGEHVRDMRGGGTLPGFGWLTGTVIEAPFDPANDVTLRRLMSAPATVGVGIPPRLGVAIDPEGAVEIIGEGNLSVFRKG